jgi:copper chaperone CopZ
MRRRRLGQLLIIGLTSFALTYILGAWLVPNALLSWTGTQATAPSIPTATTDLRRTTLAIDGMYCPACVGLVRHLLQVTPGVLGAEVRTGAARVVYDPRRVTAYQVAAVVSVYFPSTVRSEGPLSP